MPPLGRLKYRARNSSGTAFPPQLRARTSSFTSHRDRHQGSSRQRGAMRQIQNLPNLFQKISEAGRSTGWLPVGPDATLLVVGLTSKLPGNERMDGLGSADVLLFEGFRFDLSGGELFRLDPAGIAVPVMIGSRALSLLRLLVERQGKLVSKDAIMAAVWPGTVVEEGNLTVQIAALRRIID